MTHHVGDLTITDMNIKYAKTLTSVGGGLDIRAECELPALTSVGEGLYIQAECELPALTSVGEWLDIQAECELPVLTSVGGGLCIWSECELPMLTSVGGGLDICAECELPALTSVGEWLDIQAECELPTLASAYGVPGKLIAVSEYGLWKSNDGLYYAGCRQELTLDQAINHWIDRTDKRALKFIGAILANLNE